MSQKSGRAERRPAAIIYAELRNFARACETLEPAQVLQLANEFFGLAARAAVVCGGEILSVQNGSAVLAFASGGQAQVARQALQAAQFMQREFGALSTRWMSEHAAAAAAALGLHIGETVFGMVGPAGAEQSAAFGDSASVAERLMHRARAGEIVLSGDIVKLAGGANAARPLPSLQSARRAAIPIYGIVLENRLPLA